MVDIGHDAELEREADSATAIGQEEVKRVMSPPHPIKSGVLLRAGVRTKQGRWSYYEPVVNGRIRWRFFRYANDKEKPVLCLLDAAGKLLYDEDADEGYVIKYSANSE